MKAEDVWKEMIAMECFWEVPEYSKILSVDMKMDKGDPTYTYKLLQYHQNTGETVLEVKVRQLVDYDIRANANKDRDCHDI